MLRDGAAPTYRSTEATAAFRNIVALSVIPYSRASLASYPRSSGVFWGDAFLFHPWMVGRDNEHVVGQSPALLHVHLVEEFRGQTSPTVPVLDVSDRDVDRPLFDELARRWERGFKKKTRGHKDTKLFRSLNMAYNASLVPTASSETLVVDIGRMLALWVSAFEILVHPGKGGVVTKDRVLDVLDHQAEWARKDVAAMTYPAFSGKNEPLRQRKLSSWFYSRLYEVRNDFLHGNPIASTSHRVERRGKKSLLDIAAPLYRFALSSTLGIQSPPRRVGKFDSEAFAQAVVRRNTMFVHFQRTFEDALVAALGRRTYARLFGHTLRSAQSSIRRMPLTAVKSA
jgi:hypothetical protein